jgi:pimeloyl-ACP methyl ester carboxylesterase
MFTFAFADLRGYGRSISLEGEFCLAESCQDVLHLTTALGWEQFSLIGHSMSTLIALRVAQQHPDKVERLILLAPPPPSGFGVDEKTLRGLEAIALTDDERRAQILAPQFGERLAPGWMSFKLRRWRETGAPNAVAGYCSMFARDGLPDLQTQVVTPTLAVTGEQDAPHMRSSAVSESLRPFCTDLSVTSVETSGHYPMQEAPPLTAAIVQQFIAERSTPNV